MTDHWIINNQLITATTEKKADTLYITIENRTFSITIERSSEPLALVTLDGKTFPIYFIPTKNGIQIFLKGKVIEIAHSRDEAGPGIEEGRTATTDTNIEAPMPGKILKILVSEGQKVSADERLFILEAMKMENVVVAPRAGVVKRIHFKENDLVSLGQVIIEMEYTD